MANRLRLNHAATDHNQRLGNLLFGSGLVVTLALLLWLHQLNQRTRAMEQDINRMQHPQQAIAAPKANGRESAAKRDEITAVRQVMTELALPWQPLFQALEKMANPDIRLISVEPNPRQHKVRIMGESNNIDAMLDYVQQLSAQPVLHEVFLLGHEQAADGSGSLHFTVEAAWHP